MKQFVIRIHDVDYGDKVLRFPRTETGAEDIHERLCWPPAWLLNEHFVHAEWVEDDGRVTIDLEDV